MPNNHAALSASSSHRWLECPPSAKLCSQLPDTSSEYAQEGKDAHSLCEHKLKLLLGLKSSDPTENLNFYNEEMERCANEYAEYVSEQVEKAKTVWYAKTPLYSLNSDWISQNMQTTSEQATV